MARSFSQEPRSDSHKIGETRYRMSHLPSTTAIARTLLLAGILLAVTVLAARSFFPAFAQTLEVDKQSFYENSEDSVAVYTAMDPEEEDVVWSLEGTDEEFFSIDSGVLTFKSPPDFECPKPEQGVCSTDTGDDRNDYDVTVVVEAGTGGNDTATRQPVEVTVMNVEEPGNLNLMTNQPKVDAVINPALSDDDGHTDNDDTKDFGDDDAEWQWATSTSASGTWNDIKSTDGGTDRTYTPRKSDVGLYLRLTATYEDGSGKDDPFTDDVDESKDTISAVSANPVEAAVYVNARPKFKDRDTDKDGNQPDATFEVKEDLKPESSVGDKIVASDIGADGNEETLRYVLQKMDGTDHPSDYTFVIDSATAQISLGVNKKLDFDVPPRTYEFYVQAYDPSNASSTLDDRAMVTIDVLNVDEAPTIDPADTVERDGLSSKSLEEFDSDDPATTYDRSISTYTASDPEDGRTDRNEVRDLKWTLNIGGDSGRFELFQVADDFSFAPDADNCDNLLASATGTRVMLCLKEAADYEARDLTGNHIYDVTVTVTDSDGMKASRDVDVRVTNVEETGRITLSHVQPEDGTLFKAVHFDPDGNESVASWEWATSTNGSAPWNPISRATSANYEPDEDDVGDFLQVTVRYTDGCGTETEGCDNVEVLTIASALDVKADGKNNADPVFVDQDRSPITSVEWTIPENSMTIPTRLDDSVGDVDYFSATDTDDINLILFLSGSESNKFAIVNENAEDPIGVYENGDIVNGNARFQLIVTEALNYEADSSYSFSVKAKDASGDEGTLSVTVTVTQVDEVPEFTTKEDSFSYQEHDEARVATFAARDPEDGSNITWSLSGPDEDDFSIATNGVLTFVSSPDYESPTDREDTSVTPDAVASNNVYDLSVEATDRTSNTRLHKIKVTVTNKEEDGTISLSPSQPRIRLDTAGNPIAVVEATLIDPDGKDGMRLPLCTGLTVPSGDPCEFAANDIDLSVNDDSAGTSITEWQWATSTSASGPWNDVEGNAGNTRTYLLREKDAGLYLRATATYMDANGVDDVDTKGDESEDVVEVVSARVLMADYRNSEPMFPDQDPDLNGVQNATTTRKVFENAVPGTLVGDPIAFMDEGEDGNQETLFYTLMDPTADSNPDTDIDDDKFFVIDSSTGQIRVSDAAADPKIDYEVLDFASNQEDENDPPRERVDYQYEVTVTATDPSNATSSTKVIIRVLDVDEAPKFDDDAAGANNYVATTTPESTTATDFELTVQPEDTYNRRISTYFATDDEDDQNDAINLKWSLTGADSEKFELSPGAETLSDTECNNAEASVRTATGSGVLVCFDSGFSPDFESPEDSNGDNVYNVTVVVTDDDDNTASRAIAVTVSNEEEDGTVSLGSLVPEVSTDIVTDLSDLDGGERDITWQWFTIDDNVVNTAVCDLPPRPRTWTRISGETSNTYTPVSGDVDKCLAAVATYRDAAGVNDPFTIPDESLFTATGTATYVVTAADSNNKAPVFPDQDDTTQGDQSDRTMRHVYENTKRNSADNLPMDQNATTNRFGIVGFEDSPTSIEASIDKDGDPNKEADILTYTLGGPDASSFTIDSVAAESVGANDYDKVIGRIRVGANTELDFETKDTYTVHVIATDPSGASDTIIVTIKVVDVDETPKVSKKGLAVSGDRSVTVAERSSGDVATYTASGADASGATWSLEGTDAGDFNISSGILSFRSTPNYESPADQNTDNVYNVTVKATSGNISATRSVTVTVTNVNEDGSVSISPSGQPRVGTALTASVTDGDNVVANSVSWQWASSSNGSTGWGDISGATTATYTPVDGDAGNFLRATASYTDGHGPGKSENEVTSSAVAAETVAGTPGTVSLSPTTQLTSGDPVTASLTDPDNPVASSYVWRWERSADGSTNWSNISAATSASYTTTNADAGNYLRATVTYEDDSGTGQTAGPVATTDRVKLHTYDADANGRINRSEVIEAIRDFLVAHSISRAEVIE